MKRHALKTWPSSFCLAWDGWKSFDLRKDDRRFEVGDLVILEEFDPATGSYSGRRISAFVTSILRDAPGFGLMPGHAILGLDLDRRSETPDFGCEFSDHGVPILDLDAKLRALKSCLSGPDHAEDAMGHLFDLIHRIAPGWKFGPFDGIAAIAAHYGRHPAPIEDRP